ncbi:MAG: Nif3-like dinuclear metal center hexameric protein [Clostridia bacterium]|nr:Nif3-like dinuclear metal center hexameric protein [Clostridia bacterium]
MTKVADVYRFIDSLVSFGLSESWDNSGLLVGDMDGEVKKIAVVLDVNEKTVARATEEDVDLIVSHHPIIFKPKNNFLADSLEYRLAVNKVSVISCHTCFDSAEGGVNDVLCELLGIKNVRRIESPESEQPLVRAGEVDEISGREFAKKVSKALKGKVTLADSGKTIKTVAVCTGSGGDFVGEIIKLGIDAFVTGEASYHTMCDAKDAGLTVVAAGHFETEKPAMISLEKKLKDEFDGVEFVEIDETCPFEYY